MPNLDITANLDSTTHKTPASLSKILSLTDSFTNRHIGPNQAEIKQMLESVFSNRDQQLSYEEFAQNFQQLGLGSKNSDRG